MTAISKILSANDLGITGGHQAGILIPKNMEILSFFPKLDSSIYNPRIHLNFEDSSGAEWEFAFIYYNNELFGKTRNEYRLTRMTRYLRQSDAKVGDEIFLRSNGNKYEIILSKKHEDKGVKSTKIVLGGGWKVVQL